MKPLAAGLLALTTLALGFVGGMLTSDPGGRAERTAEPPTVRPSPSPTAAAAPERSLRAAEAPREVLAPSEPAPATPKLSEATFQRALADVGEVEAAPEATDDTGAITGIVLDPQGSPIAGAQFVAYRSSAREANDSSKIGQGRPADRSLEETLRREAESWTRRRAARRLAESGADGRFELTGLEASSTYQVHGYLEGHLLKTATSSWQVSCGQHLTFTSAPVFELPVELVLPDGMLATEGVVGIRRGDETQFYSCGTEEPLRQSEGRVMVRAYAGVENIGWRSIDSAYASEEIPLDIATHEGVLRFDLLARGGIRGRLVDRSGLGRPHARVKAAPLGSGADIDPVALSQGGSEAQLRGGQFAFGDLEPGRYAVGLVTWNGGLLGHTMAEVTSGYTEVEIVLDPPDPSEHLVVRAMGPGGTLLRDLQFQWLSRTLGGSRSGQVEAQRDPTGVFWLKPDETFFQPWGEGTGFDLTLTHAQLGNRTVSLEEGQRELEVLFEEPVTLVVELMGYEASGLAGRLRLNVQEVKEGSSQRHHFWGRDESKLSASGVATYDNLAPGKWQVSLLRTDKEYRSTTLATEEVELTRGEKVLRMAVPELYELSVFAPSLEPGAQVSLFQPNRGGGFGGYRSMALGQDRRAVFEDVAAGDYNLQVAGLPKPEQVTVPCPEIVLDARPPDCIEVRIGDLEGDLYQAGFRAGDRITSIDGEEIGGQVNRLYELLQGDKDLSCSLIREGKRIDLTLPVSKWGADWWSKMGGMLTPSHLP